MKHLFEKRLRPLLLAIASFGLITTLASPAVGAAGDLDPSFGTGGTVTTQRFGIGNDIAFQTNGKIVVAGDVKARFAVARFRSDGRFDPTFAGDGIVSGLFPGYGEASTDIVQGDGKIVAIGHALGNFALVRFNKDGTLDKGFGAGGKVLTFFGDPASCDSPAYGGALGRHGKIVAAGFAQCSGGRSKFAVARYMADGTLDKTFSGNGKVEIGILLGVFDREVAGVVVMPDGKIVIAGSAQFDRPSEGEGGSYFALARFDADGTLDTTFGGGDGIVTTSFESPRCNRAAEAHAMALQPDGKIVVGGDANCAATVGGIPHPVSALARYRPNGGLDATFGGDGKVTGIPGARGIAYVYGIAIQPNGRIVTSGVTSRFALLRYRAGGRQDTTFGNGGIVMTFRGGFAAAVAIQKDRRIVAAGFAGVGLAMARYLP